MKQITMHDKSSIFLLAALSVLPASCSMQKTVPVRPPLMGWSSWNAFMVNISDSIIRTQADNLVTYGLRDAGFAQVDIDDGFFGVRDGEGNMTAHATRFPQGLKGVVDHIHAAGMKAGTYSDAGSNTCGSMYNRDSTGIGAGLYGHDAQDADLYFNQWGFDFIKIDYCGGRQAEVAAFDGHCYVLAKDLLRLQGKERG